MSTISDFTLIPLYIEMLFDDITLASGTGFTVLKNSNVYLLTNRHNVTGRNNFTGECLSDNLAVPNKLKIYHHKAQRLGEKTITTEEILDFDGHSIWYEHPTLKEKVDVVAIKLTNLDNVHIIHLTEFNDTPFTYGVTDSVSVVGYPYGLRADTFPVWVTGSIATDPIINFENLPVTLVNCTSRSGMSGSPVIMYKSNGQIADIDGFGTRTIHEPSWRFLGIYSGRVATSRMSKYESSEIGRIWKAEIIYELINFLD